jgi:hypothetical protein
LADLLDAVRAAGGDFSGTAIVEDDCIMLAVCMPV